MLIARSHWESVPVRGTVGNLERTRTLSVEELDAYFASYAGMLGNASAPIWLCDLSPIANGAPLAAPPVPCSKPEVWDAEFRRRNEADMARWGIHQAMARIMVSAYFASPEADMDWKSYFRTKLYAPHGGDFCLSLFPMPIGSGAARSWKQSYADQPELNPQRRYFDLCRLGGRFPFIAALRKRMAPKVIACFGPRHADDFLSAFGFVGTPGVEVVLQPADQAKQLQVFTKAGTTLVIAPAIGGITGLNSEALQHAFGGYVAQLLSR
jgi:transcriptional activator of eps genes